jgi:nicotinate phosphoribosyltransferase
MALISELYFTLRGVKKAPDWIERIHGKGKLLSENGCHFIDFSTRRRFSGEVQDMVVSVLKNYAGFLGTSNPYLAYKHGVPPSGTFAHEYVQFMAAYYSPRLANPKATEHWSRHYAGDLGIALTDTFTTDVFLRDFDMFQAKLYDGVRHDSEDPYAWADKMLAHYKRLGILTGNKRFVFSDALKIGPPDQKMIGNAYNYIPLDLKFRQFAQPVGGIGTFFSNDICTIEDQANGIKPLNIVIKLATADYGRGPIPVVKLSDEPGKHTGDPEAIAQVKRELGIA